MSEDNEIEPILRSRPSQNEQVCSDILGIRCKVSMLLLHLIIKTGEFSRSDFPLEVVDEFIEGLFVVMCLWSASDKFFDVLAVALSNEAEPESEDSQPIILGQQLEHGVDLV